MRYAIGTEDEFRTCVEAEDQQGALDEYGGREGYSGWEDLQQSKLAEGLSVTVLWETEHTEDMDADRAIFLSEITLTDVFASLEEMRRRYRATYERGKDSSLTTPDDDEIKARMSGHAIWDDPPSGWGEKELCLWSRGCLWAEEKCAGNIQSYLRCIIHEFRPFTDSQAQED